jgi:hypothetical protein
MPLHPAEQHLSRIGRRPEKIRYHSALIEAIAAEEQRSDLELKDSESFRIENKDSNI